MPNQYEAQAGTLQYVQAATYQPQPGDIRVVPPGPPESPSRVPVGTNGTPVAVRDSRGGFTLPAYLANLFIVQNGWTAVP